MNDRIISNLSQQRTIGGIVNCCRASALRRLQEHDEFPTCFTRQEVITLIIHYYYERRVMISSVVCVFHTFLVAAINVIIFNGIACELLDLFLDAII